MRGSRFISFLLILTMSTSVWTGCGENPAPPADAGTVIEDASDLPGANQPYPIKQLDGKETPEAAETETGKTEPAAKEEKTAESKTE